jgi:hypothetical protein
MERIERGGVVSVLAASRKLAILSGLASIAAAGTVFFWVRSYRGPADETSWQAFHTRYTLRADRGKLVLLGPPESARNSEAVNAVARITNADIGWEVMVQGPGREVLEAEGKRDIRRDLEVTHAFPSILSGEGRSIAGRFHRAELSGPLLAALEDPRRFAAAHVLLVASHLITPGSPSVIPSAIKRAAIDRAVATFDGLDAELRPSIPWPPRQLDGYRSFFRVSCQGEQSLQIDVAQLPRIRRQWHDRLDTRVLSMPFGVLVGALLLPPGAWFWRRWRQRVFRRRGRCPNCGYDLRESKDRCPECGVDSVHASVGTMAQP